MCISRTYSKSLREMLTFISLRSIKLATHQIPNLGPRYLGTDLPCPCQSSCPCAPISPSLCHLLGSPYYSLASLLGPLSARSHFDSQLLSFIERVLTEVSSVTRSLILSGHEVARRQTPQSRVLVFIRKGDVGLTDRQVIGNTHARRVNGMWLDLFLSFFGGIDFNPGSAMEHPYRPLQPMRGFHDPDNGFPRRGHAIVFLHRYANETSYGLIAVSHDAPSTRHWSGQSTCITRYPVALLGDFWSP